MIVYSLENLKIFECWSAFPNEDWTGDAEFVIDETNPDNEELIQKIKHLAPCFDYVIDKNGNLIDVEPNDVPLPEVDPDPEPTDSVNYDDLAIAIQEGVNEV